MPSSLIHPLRLSPQLKGLIDARRGSEPFSVWLREAAIQRLEAEQGLGASFGETLTEHNTQLRGLGINLNQLARAANEGRPVVVHPELLSKLLKLLRESHTLLVEIKTRMPG